MSDSRAGSWWSKGKTCSTHVQLGHVARPGEDRPIGKWCWVTPLEALQKLPGTLGAMPAVEHTAHHLGPFPPLDGITQRQLVLDQAPWAVLASELDLAGHDLDRATTWCPQVLVNNRLHPLRVARLGEERGGETGQAHGRTVVPVSTTVRTRDARFWTGDQTRNSIRDRMAGLRALSQLSG